MKNVLKLTAAAFALAMTAQPASAEGKLSLYHWFEYIPQEMLDRFAAENDVEVTMDTFDSNEAMLATLKAGTLGSYDLSFPGDYMVKIMIEEGIVGTIEDGELKNKANIEQEWLDVGYDKGRKSSIPYQWGTTSFSVNRDIYKGDINTTDIIFDPPAELSGKINMLDSQGDVLTLAAMHLDIPQCTTDRDQLKALNALLQSSKKHWVSYNSDTAKEVLISGDAAAGMIWNGFNVRARLEGANVEYAFPKQGIIAWMDNAVLLKDAPNRDNAIKFMDFLLQPENVAELTNWTQYSAGVIGVDELLSDELKAMPEANPPADSKPVFVEACSQEVQVIYDKIWTNLKK